jgi:hypothetical protein
MLSWLNINTVQGILRTLLAFGGGILVSKGKITQDQVASLTTQLTDPQFIGTAIAVITAVWSVIHKTTPTATVTTTTTAASTAAK